MREMVVSSSSMTSASAAEAPSSSGGLGGHQQRRSRAGRVRTVLTEKQLSLLKSCYNANPRPDALMKEQLVEMTGLSPRVVRVWFQNKRCKDKKKMCLQKSKVRSSITASITNPDYIACSPGKIRCKCTYYSSVFRAEQSGQLMIFRGHIQSLSFRIV